jgi:hypothetical protein
MGHAPIHRDEKKKKIVTVYEQKNMGHSY